VTISSVRVLHANRTRRSFLERVVSPILSANQDAQFTLEEALKEVGKATDKLNRFGTGAHE
jgi:outer membrane protein insertion porin family